MDTSGSYVAPVLSLVGALAVAGLAFYQWRRQHGNPNRSASSEASRLAHEALWQQLEEVHIQFRRAPDPDAEDEKTLESALRDTNLFFLRHSLYFDERDQALINDYIAALDRVRNAVRLADRNTKREWAITAIGADETHSVARAAPVERTTAGQPVDAGRHWAAELRKSQAAADKLRASVKTKLKKAAGLV